MDLLEEQLITLSFPKITSMLETPKRDKNKINSFHTLANSKLEKKSGPSVKFNFSSINTNP